MIFMARLNTAVRCRLYKINLINIIQCGIEEGCRQDGMWEQLVLDCVYRQYTIKTCILERQRHQGKGNARNKIERINKIAMNKIEINELIHLAENTS